MSISRSDAFLIFIAASILLLLALSVHALVSAEARAGETEAKALMVRELGLTDLCIFTEARYTRHPAVSDLNTAFQDHPMSLEHFPTGALLMPPSHISKGVRPQ